MSLVSSLPRLGDLADAHGRLRALVDVSSGMFGATAVSYLTPHSMTPAARVALSALGFAAGALCSEYAIFLADKRDRLSRSSDPSFHEAAYAAALTRIQEYPWYSDWLHFMQFPALPESTDGQRGRLEAQRYIRKKVEKGCCHGLSCELLRLCIADPHLSSREIESRICIENVYKHQILHHLTTGLPSAQLLAALLSAAESKARGLMAFGEVVERWQIRMQYENTVPCWLEADATAGLTPCPKFPQALQEPMDVSKVDPSLVPLEALRDRLVAAHAAEMPPHWCAASISSPSFKAGAPVQDYQKCVQQLIDQLRVEDSVLLGRIRISIARSFEGGHVMFFQFHGQGARLFASDRFIEFPNMEQFLTRLKKEIRWGYDSEADVQFTACSVPHSGIPAT